MKNKYFLLLAGIVIGTLTFSQGILNKGAVFVINENANVLISGARGNFTNQSFDAFHGSVDLDGSMIIEGGWANNATSGEVFINQNKLGTVLFGGALVKHTIGASGNSTQFEHVVIAAGNELDIPVGAGADVSYSIINHGVLNVDGDLYLQGSIVNNGIITGTGVIHYNGSLPQEIIPGTFSQIEINNLYGANLLGNLNIDTKLILTQGIIVLGDFNLSLSSRAVVEENKAVSWIDATGNGQLIKAFSNTGFFNFPVGNGGSSSAYSPVEFNLTSGTCDSAWVGMNLKNEKYPENIRGPNVLNRYWVFQSYGLLSFTYDASFFYVDGDVTGSDAELDGARLESAPPPVWRRLGPAQAAGNYVEALNQTEFSAFTGVEYFKPPQVPIVNPADGSIVYDYPLQVFGTATDADMDLTDVFVSLNYGPWEAATGTYNWTKDVILLIGQNSIRVKAKDIQNLDSPIVEHHVSLSIQIIPITTGWSIISAYLTPNNPALEPVMADIRIPENLTIMLGERGIYWPHYNINSIGDWNIFEGYKVKCQYTDELIIRGDKLIDNSITFSAGFYIIPVLSNVSAPIAQIFGDPVNDVTYLYDLTSGLIYWPGGGIMNLMDLIPGRGYLASFNKEVTINFPDYTNLKSTTVPTAPISLQTGPWDYSRTDNVHLFSIEHDAAKELKNVNHIGVFNSNNICVGSVEINQSNENCLLTVFSDDESTTAIDGVLENEPLTFKAYNQPNDLEFKITPVFNENMPNISGEFKTNGMSMIVNFKESSTGVTPHYENVGIELFPNPASDQVMLIYPAYSDTDIAFAEIVNSNGKLMKQISINQTETKICVSLLQPGVYVVKISTTGNVVYKKLIIR